MDTDTVQRYIQLTAAKYMMMIEDIKKVVSSCAWYLIMFINYKKEKKKSSGMYNSPCDNIIKK